MSQIKVTIYISVDEHGNYQAVGSSTINGDMTRNTAISLVEDGIVRPETGHKTQSFNVMVDLPEPYIHDTPVEPVEPVEVVAEEQQSENS